MIFSVVLLVAGAFTTMIVGYASDYYTVRIDYLFDNGETAYDSYIAVFEKNSEVNVTVTNPYIQGYLAVESLEEDADPMPTVDIQGQITEDRSMTVYYIPEIVPYKVRYYLQNIYDDNFSEDLSLPDSYYNKKGMTGSFPEDLNDIGDDPHFNGFKKLYHKPDLIAADGSTEFEIYFSRNYYLINFDLNGGYGVEPVYAKYQTTYNIPEPTKKGWVFEGWVLADENGNFIDENGEPLTDEQARAAAQKFTSGKVPDHNVNYKAYWSASDARYTIVYWIEDPDSDKYTDVATETITQYADGCAVTTGDIIKLNDPDGEHQVPDFFSFNLNPQKVERNADGSVKLNDDLRPIYLTDSDGNPIDENDNIIDFPEMSPAEREELNGKSRYFEINTEKSDSSVEVIGDGTTRFNIYYKRKLITQRFFFARKTDDGKYQIPGWTRAFSTKGGTIDNHLSANWGNATHWQELSDRIPTIAEKYRDKLEIKTYYSAPNHATYYYYELQTEYYSNMRENWLTDAFEPLLITKNKEQGIPDPDYALFGAWSSEWGTPYAKKTNKTVKGIYEKLDDQLLFTEEYLQESESNGYGADPLVLNYLSFWANAKNKDWNKKNAFYNFTYNNYVEILPNEYTADNQDINETAKTKYIDWIKVTYSVSDTTTQPNLKIYGLLPENVVETYDGAMEYKNPNTRDADVKKLQTPAALTGFALLTDNEVSKAESLTFSNGESQQFTQNPVCEWHEGNGFDDNHHCCIKYLYRRRYYTLGFLNNNMKSSDQKTRNIYYQMDINSTGIRGNWVYYEPEYTDAELKDYYYFDGWYFDEDHTDKVQIIENDPAYEEESKKKHFNDPFRMPADDVTLYAKWSLVKENVRFYNDYDAYEDGDNPISTCEVEYNSMILTRDVPSTNPDDNRPNLTPPVNGATFVGWYYKNDFGDELRFEPEHIPVVREMDLYAKWTSNQTANYLVEYVEKGTDIEVADPETGFAYIASTKSVKAKTNNELNDEHKPQPGQNNWWPVVTSHSMIIRQNDEGEEYAPNIYRFEYFRKNKVYYKVRYLDAETLEELHSDKEDSTSNPIVWETAEQIDGYLPDRVKKSIYPAASIKENADEAMAEELETNVIVFLYTKNENQARIRIEHLVQKVDGDPENKSDYEFSRAEILTKDFGDTIDMNTEIYGSELAVMYVNDDHFIINKKFTEVDGTDFPEEGTTVTVDKKQMVIKVFYKRGNYPYKILYVDINQERLHSEDPELYPDDGVLETHAYTDEADWKPMGTVINIDYPEKITKDEIDYYPITADPQTLTIYHENFDPENPDPKVNVKKIYYEKEHSVTIRYEKVCPGAVDSDFAFLSQNYEIVSVQSDIMGCTALDNDEHNGKYIFVGWYKTEAAEETDFITAERQYTPELPEHDITYYAVFKMVPTPYKLVYRFTPRVPNEYVDEEGYNSFVVIGEFKTDEEINTNVDKTGDNPKLTTEFILSHAPYESNFGKIIKWDEDNIEQKIEDGVLIATLTAEQDDKPVYVYYRLTPDGPYDKTIKTSRGANRAIDPEISALLAANEYGGKQFSYWAIRKSADDNAEIVAKCYDAHFTYCIMDDYYITPVYDGAASPVDDGELITLTHLQYTRNRWTTADGVVNLNGSTDLLYTDFEIAFTDKGQRIYGDGTGYTVGVVYELCGQLDERDTFGEEYQHYESDETALAQAIGNNKSSYTFSPEAGGTVKRNLMKGVIPNAKLTNKNRVEYAKAFKNAYSEAKHSYTNSTYIMKAYAFMIDSSGNVTLSDPVYICLNGIANVDLATDSGDGSCIITDN